MKTNKQTKKKNRKSAKLTNKKRMDRKSPKTNGRNNTQQIRTPEETHTLRGKKRVKREK